MGVSVTRDEVDRQADGRREESRRIVQEGRKSGRPKEAVFSELFERGYDPTAIQNPEPGKHYKWVNRTFNEGARVNYFESKGYKLVDPKDGVKPNEGTTKDGKFIRNDTVLMECPVEVAKARQRRSKAKLDWMSGAYREAARDELNRIARNGRVAKEHEEVAFDESREGEEFESQVRPTYNEG